LPAPDQQEFVKELGQFEYYIPFNFLPLQDGIDLALSLVQTTVDVQRFSFGPVAHPGDIPGVGGTVDVLAITPKIELTAVIVAGLFFLLMVVTGSLLSLGKARNDGILALHNVGSVLTVVATFGAIYLLTRGRC